MSAWILFATLRADHRVDLILVPNDYRHVKDQASKSDSVLRANRDSADKSEQSINRIRSAIEKEVSKAL